MKISSSIRSKIKELRTNGFTEEAARYTYLLKNQKDEDFIFTLAKCLLASGDHDYKHTIAFLFEELKDARVVPHLLKAAKSKHNIGYSAPYIWACSAYDCSKYFKRFISLILSNPIAGEVCWACYYSIDNMQGPFIVSDLKKGCIRILSIQTEDTNFDNLFVSKTAQCITDKYLSQSLNEEQNK